MKLAVAAITVAALVFTIGAAGAATHTPKPFCSGSTAGGDIYCSVDYASGDSLMVRLHRSAPHTYLVCVVGSELHVGGARRKCLTYKVP